MKKEVLTRTYIEYAYSLLNNPGLYSAGNTEPVANDNLVNDTARRKDGKKNERCFYVK